MSRVPHPDRVGPEDLAAELPEDRGVDGGSALRDGDRRLRCRRPQRGGTGRAVQVLPGARRSCSSLTSWSYWRARSTTRVSSWSLQGRVPRPDSCHTRPRNGARGRDRADPRATRGRSARTRTLRVAASGTPPRVHHTSSFTSGEGKPRQRRDHGAEGWRVARLTSDMHPARLQETPYRPRRAGPDERLSAAC